MILIIFSSLQAQESSQDVVENADSNVSICDEEAGHQIPDADVLGLLWMAQFGTLEGVLRILDVVGITPDAQSTTSGNTALIIAVNRHNVEITRALLSAGADPNLKNCEGELALIQAIDTSYIERNNLIDGIIGREGDATINRDGIIDKEGNRIKFEWQQLTESGISSEQAVERDYAIIEALLEAGANIDEPDQYDYTPLMSAAIRGNRVVIELLLSRGANASYVNRNGYTAASVASFNSYFKAAQIIRARTVSQEER